MLISLRFRFLFCVIDIFSKNAWVILLKNIKEPHRKPSKIWVDKGSEFYNRSMKSWLEKNAIEMYSNEGKSVVAERLIGILKNKIYKYMTSISKNVYIDKLDNIVNRYNAIYYSTIKMEHVNAKSSTCTDSSKEINDEDPKLKISDIVRISTYKRFFPKDYVPSWSKEVFVIKKVKNTVPWTYVSSDD